MFIKKSPTQFISSLLENKFKESLKIFVLCVYVTVLYQPTFYIIVFVSNIDIPLGLRNLVSVGL